MSAILIDHVSFQYPNRSNQVIKDLSLSVKEHQLMAIIGKSGCGKSTLIRLIAGLLPSDNGCIEVKNGLKLGIVFQDPRLLPWKTVYENVELAIRDEGYLQRKQAILESLELVGLTQVANYYPSELSGGMAQRAALARALVQSPDILLMDEPFGALDAITRTQIQVDFEKIQQSKRMTVILITHEVSEAVRLADQVVVFSNGQIEHSLAVDLPHPRSITDMSVVEYAAKVMNFLTLSK